MEKEFMILLASSIVAALSFIGVIVLIILYYKLNKKYKKFMNGISEDIDIEESVLNNIEEIKYIEEKMNNNKEKIDFINEQMKKVFIKNEVIRYDAFDDVKGKQSFSICLLDNLNNGFIITGLYNPKNNNYVYAKKIVNGKAENNLSEEEKEVLERVIKK